MITRLTPGVLLPPDHRHELQILIPITLLDMTTITVIDHGMSLSVLYMTFTPGFWWGQCCSSFQFSVQGFWFCLYVFILCLVPKVACIPGLSFPDFPCSFLYVYLARDLSSESRTFELQKSTTQYDNISIFGVCDITILGFMKWK